MIIQKNWLDRPSNWPQERKNKMGNPISFGLIKTTSLPPSIIWYGLSNNPILTETLKFPFLTTIHVLNHQSIDKMIASMNQYWWESITELFCAQLLCCGWLFAAPWTVARQAPLSMGILQVRILKWLPCPPPGDLPDPGTEPSTFHKSVFASFMAPSLYLLSNPLIQSDTVMALLILNWQNLQRVSKCFCLKSLSLVLLNLMGSPFGTHELSPIETVTGCPIHLTPDSFDPLLIKGEIFQYLKGLIATIEITMFWESHLFALHAQEMKTSSITPCSLKILSVGKDTSRRNLFNLGGKAPIKYC